MIAPPDRPLVLLIDDEPHLLEVLGLSLAREGYRVRSAASGVAGLGLAWAGDPPAVVVVDVQLPDMDGLEVTARLRADPRTAGVAVVLTGAAGDGPSLPKPFRPSQLVTLLRSLV